MYTDLRLYMSSTLHNKGVLRGAFDTAGRMNECAEAVAAAPGLPSIATGAMPEDGTKPVAYALLVGFGFPG